MLAEPPFQESISSFAQSTSTSRLVSVTSGNAKTSRSHLVFVSATAGSSPMAASLAYAVAFVSQTPLYDESRAYASSAVSARREFETITLTTTSILFMSVCPRLSVYSVGHSFSSIVKLVKPCGSVRVKLKSLISIAERIRHAGIASHSPCVWYRPCKRATTKPRLWILLHERFVVDNVTILHAHPLAATMPSMVEKIGLARLCVVSVGIRCHARQFDHLYFREGHSARQQPTSEVHAEPAGFAYLSCDV